MKLGIDFGTTNSAVAAVGGDGVPAILELTPGERVQRTVVYCSTEGDVHLGNAAFRAYLAADLSGRFLRSLKAFLPQDVPATRLGRHTLEFTEIVAAYLRFLREGAERVLGEPVTEVVLGRPVIFHRDPARNARAIGQLEAAVALADLPRCSFRLEPVAAALRFERSLTMRRTVLVGDFGGGTADFAVLRIGEGHEVLAVTGVPLAGDALAGRFMDAFLMAHFGRGATYRRRYTDEIAPWNHSIQRQIQRLYTLHMLRDPQLYDRLDRVEDRISDPRVIRRLKRLVFDDLGYPMAWAIERTKSRLSDGPTAVFRFDEFYSDELNIVEEVRHDDFADACAGIVDQYVEAIARGLDEARVGLEDIDDVLLTGGTSQLPFVRGTFSDMVGEDKLRGADAFTSVCEGLVL